MEFVVTQLILHPQQNEDAAGHADGQPCNIDRSKGLVPDYVSEGDLEIVSKHGCFFMTLVQTKKVPLLYDIKYQQVVDFILGRLFGNDTVAV